MDSSLNGQPVRCVAVEQLRSIRNDILRWSQELLVSRARVEQYRTTEPQKARQFYRELEAVRQRLLSALQAARPALLELEEYKLASVAEKLHGGLAGFSLMSRRYKPVFEALTGFAKQLPVTADGVNAAVIGRMMNQVRMGYYPTDPENITHLLRGIQFPEGVTTNLLDPCCGCGKALRQGAAAAGHREQLLHLRRGAGPLPGGGSADAPAPRGHRELLSQPHQQRSLSSAVP